MIITESEHLRSSRQNPLIPSKRFETVAEKFRGVAGLPGEIAIEMAGAEEPNLGLNAWELNRGSGPGLNALAQPARTGNSNCR